MSNEDVDIELGQSVRRHIERKASPLEDPALSAVPYDSPQGDLVPVFISEKVMRAIERHVLGDKDREVGGVLLGGFYRTERGAFVEVADFIEAHTAKGTDVSLTFTHETWQQISEEQSRRDPDLQIVGWYHSHPALGVFMSREDEFIHASFFADPWHVALVVDPIHRNWGCFKWNDGSLERTSGFYVFTERKGARRLKEYAKALTTTRQPPPRAASAGADRLPKTRSTALLWAAIALLLAVQVVSVMMMLSRRTPEPDHYRVAMRLLERSDLGSGALYLRMEIEANPDSERAYAELSRVNSVISSPELARFDHDCLDRANFMLSSADRLARMKTDLSKRSSSVGEDKGGVEVAPGMPVEKAFSIYERESATREQRIERARLIKRLAGGSSARWPGPAIEWLEEERLRHAAYGMEAADKASQDAYRKLTKRDRIAVDRIRARIKGAR